MENYVEINKQRREERKTFYVPFMYGQYNLNGI